MRPILREYHHEDTIRSELAFDIWLKNLNVGTNPVKADITTTSANAARAAVPARLASFSPRRFPILKISDKVKYA